MPVNNNNLQNNPLIHDPYGNAFQEEFNSAVGESAKKLVNTVKKRLYNPVMNPVHKGILKARDVLIYKESGASKYKYESVSGAKGLKKIKAAAWNYDICISKHGDQISLKAGQVAYTTTKLVLNILTGTLISRSKVGRILQEGISTLVGAAARLAVKVGEYVARALPYLAIIAIGAAIGAGIGLGGYHVVLGMAALYAASKLGFASAIFGTAIIGYVALNEYRHRKLSNLLSKSQEATAEVNQKLDNLVKNLDKKENTAKTKKKSDEVLKSLLNEEQIAEFDKSIEDIESKNMHQKQVKNEKTDLFELPKKAEKLYEDNSVPSSSLTSKLFSFFNRNVS